MAAPSMHVKIYAPFQTYFEGDAESLSAANDTGPFDILPRHKNFMTLLKPCTITVRVPQRPDFNMAVEQGVMHVKADRVTVFLDV
jgi:F-type H+-transporting ATPase subunit epsilon